MAQTQEEHKRTLLNWEAQQMVDEYRKEADGIRVGVEVSATNQKGDVTAAGTGARIVPSGYWQTR